MFYDCTGLTNITLPNSLTNIGFNAFNGCIGLTSITIPSGVTIIGVRSFIGCTGLTNITIQNNKTMIDSEAFQNCRNLTLLTIVRTSAEAGIVNLLYTSVFNNTHADLRIVVPAGDVAAYKAAPNWNAAAIANRIHATGCTNTSNPCTVNCQ